MTRLALFSAATAAFAATQSFATEKHCNNYNNITTCSQNIGSFSVVNVSELNNEGPGILAIVNKKYESFSLRCTRLNPAIKLRVSSVDLKGQTNDQFAVGITINKNDVINTVGNRVHMPDEKCENGYWCPAVFYYWSAEIETPDRFAEKFHGADEVAFSIPKASGVRAVLNFEIKDADVVLERFKSDCGKAP